MVRVGESGQKAAKFTAPGTDCWCPFNRNGGLNRLGCQGSADLLQDPLQAKGELRRGADVQSEVKQAGASSELKLLSGNFRQAHILLP